MLDVKEMLYNQNKIDRRANFLCDSLSYTYDKIRIVQEFHHLTIFAFKDNVVAKVTVTYEALLDTNYIALIRKIKEAIKASFECACTIPIEYEYPFI